MMRNTSLPALSGVFGPHPYDTLKHLLDGVTKSYR